MIDLKIVRTNPELVRDSIAKRNLNINLDDFLEIDRKRLNISQKLDELREIKNKVSKEIPTLEKAEKEAKIIEMKDIGEQVKTLEEEFRDVEVEFNNMYWRLPNFLDETTAIGPDDSGNLVEKTFGEKPKFDFEVQPHYEIGAKKGWIDTEKGAEISGARFWYLKGDLVFLQFALVSYALSKLASKGFIPVLPPVLAKQQAMFGTGYFPADENGIYRVNPGEDDLFLVGTAEVPVTSYHAGEILENLDYPIKYVGYSACFRREAGSAGKDMRGILRGHQFDKVEMVCFCKPEDSKNLHNEMVAVEEEIRQGLGIPYQKVNICSGDLGNPALKKYDLEAWMPAQDKYREVTSCSNVGEFQSRRLQIRYRNAEGKPEYVHTLNGTVIALSRCLIAIIENYQDKNGDVIIPEVLRPFMGGREKI